VAPTLIDFGVAKFVVADDAASRTATGVLLGTPLYMSPEQVSAAPDVDARADVWAMGVILYELLAGASPFRAESAGAVLRRVVEHRPPPLASVAPVPQALAAVVDRAMDPDRRRRFPSARAMLDALTAATRADATAPTLDARPPAAAPRRARWPVALGALAAVALGLAAGRLTRAPRPYAVALRADAPGAVIELDGRPVGGPAWRGTFARDGVTHVARVRAAGRGERVIRFCDDAPPERVTLPPGASGR
jgi:hypothetical protein